MKRKGWIYLGLWVLFCTPAICITDSVLYFLIVIIYNLGFWTIVDKYDLLYDKESL